MSNMTRTATGYFYESATERPKGYEEYKNSFGASQKTGEQDFNDVFNSLYESYKDNHKVDIKRDFAAMIGDRGFMEQYKADLLEPVFEAYREANPNDPHAESVIREVSKFWDTKVKSYNESASVTGFLPIATLEFPVLVKQFFSSIMKDIIEVESVKSPNQTKHIRVTYLVDNNTGDEYEYPKCMFDGTWREIQKAARGFPISNEVVPLTNNGLFKYNIVKELTDGTDGFDKLSYNIWIDKVQVGGKTYPIPGNGITVEFSTNGTLVNGDLNFTTDDGTEIDDVISGQVNFRDGTISLSSAAGQVTGVCFQGYLSNEKNMRHVSVRERRQILRFVIEDGPRWNMPFSIEEIEDAAALLDMNYYNRMVDEIVKTQEMNECMTVIEFLDNEFKKFNGVKTDTYKLESLAMTKTVDLAPPAGFAGDPFSYMTKAIQFRLKALIHELNEQTKNEGLAFVISGNPMACQLLNSFTDWKTSNGTSIGGIKVNGAYGMMSDMNANIRVVASNLYDPYTIEPMTATSQRELILHITAYPTTDDRITFRHLKYTSHLFTSQSQTAYESTNAPGGAYQIVTATSRFKDIVVQGIQADLVLLHSDLVYGDPGDRDMVSGAPWD